MLRGLLKDSGDAQGLCWLPGPLLALGKPKPTLVSADHSKNNLPPAVCHQLPPPSMPSDGFYRGVTVWVSLRVGRSNPNPYPSPGRAQCWFPVPAEICSTRKWSHQAGGEVHLQRVHGLAACSRQQPRSKPPQSLGTAQLLELLQPRHRYGTHMAAPPWGCLGGTPSSFLPFPSFPSLPCPLSAGRTKG